jgi:carbonic anhydrase
MNQVARYLKCVCCLVLLAQLGLVSGASGQQAKKPSPDTVLQMLKEGNRRFYSGKATYPHLNAARLAQAGKEDQGDHAYATIIACSDSRVPVELIFDAGVMDIFVVRVAGNACNTDEAGSIEYGMAHVRTPVFVMLGHTQCGAVTAVTHALHGTGHALERNIPPLVENIIPAVKRAEETHRDVLGDNIIPYAIEQNVWQGIEDLFMKSPVARNLVQAGKVKVVGAIYDVATGKVKWLPLKKVDQILKKVETSSDKETEPFAAQHVDKVLKVKSKLVEKKMAEKMGFEVKLQASHSEAIARVTEALKTEGFGILTRADVDQAFRDKLGIEFRPYTILGACNPKLALAALSSKPEIGLMLPCNVTVEAVEDGCIVRIVNPNVMMKMGDLGADEAIAEVARDATERLQHVAEKLGG